jgi:hypothetical protein
MREMKRGRIDGAFLLLASGWMLFIVALWIAYRRGLLAGLVVMGVLLLQGSAPPASLFREHIRDPIPTSVAEIRVDRARKFFGYGYVFHFRINKADADLIMSSRSLQRVYNVGYAEGDFVYAYDSLSGGGIAVYAPGREPSWFTPRKWLGRMQAYEAHEVKYGDLYTWLLLYNEQLGEAYFLAFKGDP